MGNDTKVVTSIRIRKDVFDRLKTEADLQYRSVSNLLDIIIELYLNKL